MTDLDPWNDAFFGESFPAFPSYTPDDPPTPRDRRVSLLARVLTLLTIIGCSILAVALTGCQSSRSVSAPAVVLPTATTATSATAVAARTDSIFVHDSIYIRELIHGDTVRLEVVKYRTLATTILDIRRDTVTRTDTIYIPIPAASASAPAAASVPASAHPIRTRLVLSGIAAWLFLAYRAFILLRRVNLGTIFARIVKRIIK